MTFVVLNVSIGIIMTAYEKVSASFTAMEKNSLIDVLVNCMFTDMCNDLLEEWTVWAERRTAQYMSRFCSFNIPCLPTCLKKSKGKSSQVPKDDEEDEQAETVSVSDTKSLGKTLGMSADDARLLDFINTKTLLALMDELARDIWSDSYDPLLARVDHIYAKPESGLYMLYTDPDDREDPLSFILVTTSLVVKTAEAKQLEIEATAERIDDMKAFQMDPAYAKTMMSTQKSEREKFVQDMTQGAVRDTSRVHQAIHDLRITSGKLDLVLAVFGEQI